MSADELRLQIVRDVLAMPDDQLTSLSNWLVHQSSTQSTVLQSATRPVQQQRPIHWPHAPLHSLSEQGTYFVTGATLHKKHLFRGEARLDLLQGQLLELAGNHQWHIEAWAVFSNHYHFVAHSTAEATPLNVWLSELHTATATEINELDHVQERRVWYNFRETRLTFENSYLARLNYVHQNAVRHGLVPVANQYRWCSAAWFERTATPAQVSTIYSFKVDRVNVGDDDFELE